MVELDLVYRPDPAETGTLLGVGGLADIEVLVDGAPSWQGELRTRPEDDPATAVLNPPWTAVDLTPADGATPESLRITVRYRAMSGGIPDSLALRIGTPPLAADEDALIAAAAAAAALADTAFVVVGTTSEVESEGFDRSTLARPGRQGDLVRAVAAANPRTVVVVNACAPVLLPWRNEVAAVVVALFPGQEFGHALADILSGDREPGGRLPVTWPAQEEDLPVSDVTPVDGVKEYREGVHIGYRAWRRSTVAPAYSFGFGLGYTTMVVESLDASPDADGSVRVQITVRNTCNRRGKTIVQIFASRTDSTIDRPALWLIGLAAIELDAGPSTTVELTLPRRRFEHWYAGWRLEAGVFQLTARLHVDDAACTTTMTLAKRGGGERPVSD